MTASRQDIDASSQWNRSLLRAIPVAFLKSVKGLNQGPTRYSWLCLLRERAPADDFFDPLDEMTRKLLSQHPIQMSSAGVFAKPSELFWVSPAFRDGQGKPLLSCSTMDRKYISPDYGTADLITLRRLGVREQTPEEFLSDLETLLEQQPQDIWHRASSWHSSLNKTLLSMIKGQAPSEDVRREYCRRISALCVVPLQSGTWVSSSSSKLKLVLAAAGGLDIPHGLDLVEVDPAVGQDPARQAFLLAIGVQEATHDLVCDAIVNLHAGPSFSQASLRTADLVAHANYYALYHGSRSGGRLEHSQCPKLWLRAQDGGCARGDELYMESTRKFAVRSWPEEFVKEARFLDAAYNLANDEGRSSQTRLIDWLTDCQGVQLYPRLVTSVRNGFELSDHFRTLWRAAPSSEILQLLKARWTHYSSWIEDEGLYEDASWSICRDRLVREIGVLQAFCLNGTVFPLRQTLLPVKGLSSTSPNLRGLLDVPNPDDPGWGFLRHFGVTAKIDPSALLGRLREIATGTLVYPDQVAQIYFELLACDRTEREMVRYVAAPIP